MTWNEGLKGEKGWVRMWALGGYQPGTVDLQHSIEAMSILKEWKSGKNRPIDIATLRLEILTSRIPDEHSLATLPVPWTNAPAIERVIFRPDDEGKIYPVDLVLEYVGALAGKMKGVEGISVAGYGNWGDRGIERAKEMVCSISPTGGR